jgi:hypothetical protein
MVDKDFRDASGRIPRHKHQHGSLRVSARVLTTAQMKATRSFGARMRFRATEVKRIVTGDGLFNYLSVL